MAQYLVFFNNYSDLSEFDGSNNSCLFVGPVTVLLVSGTMYLSPYGMGKDDVVTEIVMTPYNPSKYRVGSELFSSCMPFSEDIPQMMKLISFAKNGTRLFTYSEYGYLNHVKYATGSTTVAILGPNSKKVEGYLNQHCPAKARQNINPMHPAIVIFKKFDFQKISYIILAHSTPAEEIGQELIQYNEAWFNYITQEQKLFPEDARSVTLYDAVFGLDRIASGE
jgi:hypothetical protein